VFFRGISQWWKITRDVSEWPRLAIWSHFANSPHINRKSIGCCHAHYFREIASEVLKRSVTRILATDLGHVEEASREAISDNLCILSAVRFLARPDEGSR
jgi:hypothetical protein